MCEYSRERDGLRIIPLATTPNTASSFSLWSSCWGFSWSLIHHFPRIPKFFFFFFFFFFLICNQLAMSEEIWMSKSWAMFSPDQNWGGTVAINMKWLRLWPSSASNSNHQQQLKSSSINSTHHLFRSVIEIWLLPVIANQAASGLQLKQHLFCFLWSLSHQQLHWWIRDTS